MAGGYFTDVVLRRSKNYHQEGATEIRLLSTDVTAALGAVISRFHGVVRCGISVNESLNLWVWVASLCGVKVAKIK
jgi:ribulose-5-phosphate 4-epimerase/fuculose-1-phosphate aldolase